MSASTVAAIVARVKTTGLRCYDAEPSSPTYPYVVAVSYTHLTLPTICSV